MTPNWKRPENVQSFAVYWAEEREMVRKSRAPEAYARRAWYRCQDQWRKEYELLEERISEAEARLADLKFSISTAIETTQAKRSDAAEHARCLDMIHAMLELPDQPVSGGKS